MLNIYPVQCTDKDCLENIRVYLTNCGQEVVDRAISVKVTKAEVIWVFTDVEPVPFDRGFYSIYLQYYFKVTLQVYTGLGNPTEVEGLATFEKKVILFGSEGNAKIFESKYKEDAFDAQLWKKTNMPHAVVEVGDYKRKRKKEVTVEIVTSLYVFLTFFCQIAIFNLIQPQTYVTIKYMSTIK